MKPFIKVMKALSNPNRVKIVKMLQQKNLCVCEIQNALQISQSNVSKHLKLLEEASLVDYQKDGLWVNYFIADKRDNPYAARILENLEHWLEDEPQIVELVKKVPLLDREALTADE